MKKLLIIEDTRTLEATVNTIDHLVVVSETLDEELMTITMSFNEYMNLFNMIADRIEAALS